MAWSETMFIIQHFYNVFRVDERLTDLEYKTPLVAKDINGSPENIKVEDLTPGTLWFIEDDNNPSLISGLSILNGDNVFEDPIPFSVDLNNVSLDDDVKNIVNKIDPNTDNYYDLISLMLEILVTVPVERGGTGKTSISKDCMLVGNADNTYREIGFDSAPTQRSENLVNSGALFELMKKYAKKQHASSTDEYGVGTKTLYGHLKITSDLEEQSTDPDNTAASVTAVKDVLDKIDTYLDMFQIIDNNMLYSGVISAYRPKGMKQNELRLIDSYFTTEINNTSNHTLVIN